MNVFTLKMFLYRVGNEPNKYIKKRKQNLLDIFIKIGCCSKPSKKKNKNQFIHLFCNFYTLKQATYSVSNNFANICNNIFSDFFLKNKKKKSKQFP